MNPTVVFLTSLGQALAAMSLYAPSHPMRSAARDRTLTSLLDVLARRGPLRLSFLDEDVIVGTRVMTELRGWDWGVRLAKAGVRRLEVDALPSPTAPDLERLLEAVHARIVAPASEEFPAYAVGGMRIGPLGVVTEQAEDETLVDLLDAMAHGSLDPEADAVRWIHDEVAHDRAVPMAEVESVIHALATAMHRDQHVVFPLLELKTVDQYTTTHSCNVAMLAMGLAERLGLSSSDVREIGTAALLHDIGKVRVPTDILVKPGRLTDDEFALMRLHPVDGARILSERGRGHALAAVVAYEHHVWEDGTGGYPRFSFARSCHYASRLVHVCDLYDALSTRRPYRDAWPRERTLAMLEAQAGIEVDEHIVRAFASMATQVEQRRVGITDAPQNDWNASVARAAAAHTSAEQTTAESTEAPRGPAMGE